MKIINPIFISNTDSIKECQKMQFCQLNFMIKIFIFEKNKQEDFKLILNKDGKIKNGDN